MNSKSTVEELKKQIEDSEQRRQLMISQIQPHFLYNTLTAIAMKCSEDPDEAEEMIIQFSRYLRGNLESLDTNEVIPFTVELEHVKSYVDLELQRFGKRLSVEYDIDAESFKVPPLSIQPIVENAIRHGVCEKESPGTVIISTRETDTDYVVTINDDGVGFDTSKPLPDDGKRHIGIAYVRARIKELCDAKLKIASKPGDGCIAEFYFPKSTKGEE